MIHKTTRSILSVLLAALLLVTSVPLTPAFADGGGVSPQSESAEGRALEQAQDGTYLIYTAENLKEFAAIVNGTDDPPADNDADAELMNNIDLSSVCGESNSWTPIGNSIDNPYEGTFNGNGHTISGLYINTDDQGLFGYVSGTDGDNTGTVQNLSVSGTVSGGMFVGGIAGQNLGNVINCAFSGSVSGVSFVGGVVGYNGSSGTVKNCYNTGAVSGSGLYVGGVVGNNYNGSVENCYNTGDVSGNNYVGGVVGQNSGSVKNCYNTGTVTGSGDRSNVGGVVGDNIIGGTVTGCYFLKGTAKSGIGSGTGSATPLTAEEFADQSEFSSWTDFDSTWKIEPIFGRPTLQANAEIGGTANNPYKIFTATQLAAFRDLVNDENDQPADPDAHAKLMNNINLNGSEINRWTPIGNDAHQYTGTFDGNGKTISGLYIDRSDNYQGLFGYVGSSGKVQNLSVSGTVSGGWYVGGVVGWNDSGTVKNCYNTGTGTVTGNDYVGGVVGQNVGGTVENCYNTGSVKGLDSVSGSYVGGVVGANSGTVENCYNTGSVTVTGSNGRVGGVVGFNIGPVKNCYNTGSITVTGSGGRVGGVVGDNGGNVENCYNTGTVNVSGNSSAVGGVVGCNQGGSVQNCYNTGGVNVTGTGNWVGGVVGWNSSDANVTNCYNTGSVSGSYVGGVVGDNDSSVTGCYFLQQDPAIYGIGNTTKDDISQTAAKSLEDFHSGEVAYLLQSNQTASSSQVWGQAIGEDKSPVLTSDQEKTVYRVPVDLNYTGAQADQVIYTNSTLNAKEPTREGYTFDGWYDSNGNPVTAITATTAKLYAHWTAVEEPDPEPEEPPYTGKYSYEVFTSVGDNGAISVDRYATEGDKVTIDVTPDQAYKLDELVVTANGKDVELTANSDGTYSFTMPSADVKITATFAEDPDWTEPEPEPSTDVSDLFIDIAPDAWYKDAVQYAYDNGLMTGVSDTEFAPEQTTTRAMIVSILARLEGVESAEAAGFADVDDNDWYATAVNWAANVGVVNGYEDNTFQPNTAITREQLAAILMNYASYKGEDVSNRADLTSYTDQPSTWAQEAMQWAVAEGLISGVTNTELQPQSSATRAQVAAILQRFLTK